MNVKFISPRFYRETLPQQNDRLEQELEDVRLAHALTIAQQSLRFLETQKMCGRVFDRVEAEVMMHIQCRLDGVAPEYIPAAVNLIVEKYQLLV